jgi:hypothetical protein
MVALVNSLNQSDSFDAGCFITGLLAPFIALATFSGFTNVAGGGVAKILSAIGIGGYFGSSISGVLDDPIDCLH